MFAKSRILLPLLVPLAFAEPAFAQTSVQAVLETYVNIAHAKFEDTLSTAQALEKAVDGLIAHPDETTLAKARDAWRAARIPYLHTEVLRFGNPVMDEWEPQVNSWPLDEGLIDYTEGAYGTESDENAFYVANVIANPKLNIDGIAIDATTIDTELLSKGLQGAGDVEANVSTGYHAIEFLLWGQDLNGTKPGAGNRRASDFSQTACTHGHCDRRAAYLKAATSLLVADMATMEQNWRPGGKAARVITDNEKAGLAAVLTGMGSLSYGELAGERMNLGLLLHDPEEEQDCFSDNSATSHYHDALGIVDTYLGRYVRADGTIVSGPSLSELVAAKDPALDADMKKHLDATMAAMTAMTERVAKVEAYDQMIAEGNSEGNAVVKAAVNSLIAQTRVIERIIAKLDVGKVSLEGSDSLDNPASIAQ